MKKCLAAIVLAAAGCPSVTPTVTTVPPFDGPTVEFDPANSVIPFPNNLVLDPATGRVNLPAQCNENPVQMSLRTNVLNKLDGFGTYEVAMQATTNAPDPTDAMIDMNTLANNVVMFQRTNGATPLDPTTAQRIPIFVELGTTTRFTPDCSTTETVNSITIIPKVPLFQKSTYTIAILDGLANTSGVQFLPSPTWALIRQDADPVTLDASGNVIAERTPLDLGSCPQPVPSCAMAQDPMVAMQCPQLAQLCGIDQLWKAHQPALTFLQATGVVTDASHVTVAWEMTTQTTTDPLDPSVPGSPANVQGSSPLLLVQSVPTAMGAACDPGNGCTNFLTAVYSQIGTACAPTGPFNCKAIGEVYGAGLGTMPFQVPLPNPLGGTAPAVAGPWSDPVMPTAQSWPLSQSVLQVLAFIPNGPAPAAGWPVVVFGHGFGRSKNDLFVFAPQLAAAGFASIAIDFQAHGSRAVQIDNTSAGCTGNVTPSITSPCFAPFFSLDLSTTRDNIRQTVLDLQRLVRATKACGQSGCTSTNTANVPFSIDPAHIVYAGQSLGGIIGSIFTAVDPDLKSSVLNVSGVGFADILENTNTLEFVCPIVDKLIDAGLFMGEKWNGMDGAAATGLCTTPAWKQQPAYAQFASTLRWVIDPADPANYTEALGPKRYLLMEVTNDQDVPNIATDNEGALLGRTPAAADPETTGVNPASVAITTNPSAPKWVRYTNLPPDAATSFPGNTFAHGSLLAPAPSATGDVNDLDGKLGTARMQTDAITFLVLNK